MFENEKTSHRTFHQHIYFRCRSIQKMSGIFVRLSVLFQDLSFSVTPLLGLGRVWLEGLTFHATKHGQGETLQQE